MKLTTNLTPSPGRAIMYVTERRCRRMEFTFDWLLNQAIAALAWVWSFGEVKFMLGHIGINVVAAVAAGIYTKTFLLGKLGEFLYRKVLPYILLYAAFAAFGEAANLGAMRGVAFAGIEAMLVADLLDNIKKVGMKAAASDADAPPGFTVPDWLTK